MSLAGNVAHNFIDGAIVAASYLVSVETGLITTLAVILHEIPQEIGNFGILVYGGYTPRRALAVNFVSGLAACSGRARPLLAGQAVDGTGETCCCPSRPAASSTSPAATSSPNSTCATATPPRSPVWQLVMMALGVAVMTAALRLGG